MYKTHSALAARPGLQFNGQKHDWISVIVDKVLMFARKLKKLAMFPLFTK